MEIYTMQKYVELEGALADVMACITGEVIAGLRHGHFKIEIEGEAIEKGKRRVIISGSVRTAVHSVAYPSAAPACEYVPIPDGSSSDAPVISPGPSRPRRHFIGLSWRIIT